MGRLNWATVMGGLVALGLGAAMALTNPSLEAYEDYASQTLSTYLKTNFCDSVLPGLDGLLGDSCQDLLKNNQGLLTEIISNSTQRYNLGLLSIYRTTLALPAFMRAPAYQIDTIGVLGHFYTIRASRVAPSTFF